MSPPVQRQVRFDIPMDTNEESQYNGESRSPTSNAAHSILALVRHRHPPRFNFGMDIPMSAVESASPTMQQPLNVGFQLPIQAKTPPPSSTHQPFNLGFQLPPPSTPAQAALPAGPVQQPFNLGFQLTASSTPPQAELPAGPVNKPFNLGFQLTPSPTSPQAELPAGPVNKPFNLGFQLTPSPTPPQAELPASPVQQPFNLGFQLPIPINHTPVAANAAPAFNLGFDLPVPATQTPEEESAAMVPAVQTAVRRVGYATNNRPFQFNCEPLSPIGDWNPPAPVALPVRPTLASLVGDAEQAAIDIVRHLQGEEFDQVVVMMVGGSLGVSESIQDPKPNEVLDSNRILMSAFCKNQDRLTRIFKDMISLHHMAQVQDQVAPMVTALLAEVERAEELISDSDE
ncbi:uncharacterized protein EDB91DRAFT_1255253 [Suillus paluster]|uniref:uncharacterized protein n=1 Tax=Suillus paluster TaxID=48578 RepID=UPI001B8653FF|nr:uncharacterized protein EDB91DRAFT_1255253 [Suillus paluster]KAG1724389.1 hypothetical protein EDB91DRAFT_1255253 [Suillus paluster]